MYQSTVRLLLICLSLFVLGGCGGIEELPGEIGGGGSKPDPTLKPTPDLFIPDNCDNPPKHISANDGFKCIASATRGGSVVCLLPHQFTWPEHKLKTDQHNTYKCNKDDLHFDDVKITLKNGNVIQLDYAGCHNPVFLPSGKIGRQHFRNEDKKWDNIKRKVQYITMIKDNKQTCLKF